VGIQARGRDASRTRRAGFPSPRTCASAPIRPHHAVPSTSSRGGTGSGSQVRCFRSSPTRTPPPMARSRRMPATSFWHAHSASPSHRVTSPTIPRSNWSAQRDFWWPAFRCGLAAILRGHHESGLPESPSDLRRNPLLLCSVSGVSRERIRSGPRSAMGRQDDACGRAGAGGLVRQDDRPMTLAQTAAYSQMSRAHLSNVINGKVAGGPPLRYASIGRRILVKQRRRLGGRRAPISFWSCRTITVNSHDWRQAGPWCLFGVGHK